MEEPDDEIGEEAQPPRRSEDDAQSPSMSEAVAWHLRSWARTIDRWVATGELCFLVTEEGLQPATPESMADAAEKLRNRRPPEVD